MGDMAGKLGEQLGWSTEQIAAATRYLQGPVLEQLRFTGVSAGAIAAELWNQLQAIVAFRPVPPEPRVARQPGPSSSRPQVAYFSPS